MRVEVLSHAGCPHAAATSQMVRERVRESGLDLEVRERVGPFPSPTVLVNGVDVTGRPWPVPAVAACRVDLPSAEQVRAALQRAATVTNDDPRD